MTIFWKHGLRFYRPTVPTWFLDGQLQIFRIQWGPHRLYDSCNGKMTAKILFDRRSVLVGISRHEQSDGRKVTYQIHVLNLIFRVGIKKSWAQWDREAADALELADKTIAHIKGKEKYERMANAQSESSRDYTRGKFLPPTN